MKETRIRRGKEVAIPEEFQGKPDRHRVKTNFKRERPRKGRLPEVNRDREMAKAPRIDEVWE